MSLPLEACWTSRSTDI